VIFANAGEEGEIVGEGVVFDYSVKTDKWPAAFGADRKDFEVIE
jgi:hypothetical protein